MRYFFVLNHPAHYHLYKNSIFQLKENGHTCDIYIRPKDVLKELLDSSKLEYKVVPYLEDKSRVNILFASIWGLIKKDTYLFNEAKQFKPDLLIGTDWAIVHVGKLLGIPSLVFNEDDTIATPENRYFYPFADVIVMPESCDKNMWKNKRIAYQGYHELAYLHPNVFKPKKNASITKLKPYILIRLVQLTASHDIGKEGLGIEVVEKIIKKYQGSYNIVISNEKEINGMKQFVYRFPPSEMHHYLANADLVIGDSQTMIAEAAVLGVPSIRFNDFVGKLSYLGELEEYGLTFGISTSNPDDLFKKINELLNSPNLKSTWQKKRDAMLNEKINVAAFITWFIENYPKSFALMRENPSYQDIFRSNNESSAL